MSLSKIETQLHTIVLQQLFLQLGQRHPVLRRTAAIIIETHLVQLRRQNNNHRNSREELTFIIAQGRTLKPPRGSRVYLQPEVVFRLVCNFSVIIADVTFPDQTVDGSLIWVSAVPQYTAVVKTKFVFGIR